MSDQLRIPIRLTKDSILEAIFEIRFDALANAADLLTGLMFNTFSEFKDTAPERLASVNIPKELLQTEPQFKYSPRVKLRKDNFNILIGDHSLGMAIAAPYNGWEVFSGQIEKMLSAVKETGIIKKTERFAIKYLNVVEFEGLEQQFESVNFNATLGNFKLVESLTQIRTEIIRNDFINIIEIVPNTKFTRSDGLTKAGLLFAIDTIGDNVEEWWENFMESINRAHETEKEVFYNILSAKTLEKFGPVYE